MQKNAHFALRMYFKQSFDVYERFKKKTEFPKYLSLTLSCLRGPFFFPPSLATVKTQLAKIGSDRPNSTLICYDILLNRYQNWSI
jgi:hypothetical protein